MTSIHPESEFNLKVEQIIESENKKGPVAKILCSVRTIVVLFLVLSVATLLIIITLFSAASISSVVQLSSSSRSVATRSVQALLTEKMRLPQTLAYQLITPLTMNSLSLSDNELVECLGALYSVAYQTTQIMKGTELRFSLWDANNDNYASITASSMDLIANASMFYHWRGYSSDISRANVQFVNNLPTLNNFNPNQFISQILWNNTRDSYRDYRKGFATWIPARLSDECSIGEDHCSTVIGYMVPKTILNGTDEILIYATFDYAVSDISSALADLKGKYKSMYIVEKQTGNLIASNDESEMLVRYTNGIPEMIRAEDSKNELISESIHAIRRKFGSSLQKLGESNGKMQEGSLKYQVSSGVAFCDIIYFSAGPGMEWVIVISTLQASTLRKYIALIVTAEVISVLMGLLTIIIGIFMLKTVGGALKQLQKDSSLLVKMKLERFQNSTISSLTEFSTIQTSLMQVVNRLMEYKAFLPNAVILRDFGSAEVHGVDPIDWSTDEQELQQSDEANIEIPTSPSDTKFNIGIEPSISSVLYLQIVNLDNLIANKSMPDFVLLHSKMMKIVELSVKRCRGVLVDFTESKAVVHWSNMRIGPKLCCQCALLIQQELNWMKELHVVISVVTSDGYYGTLGTRTRKQFTAFGKSRHASKSITKINALQFKVPILICETTKNSCDSLVVRPISSVKFDKYRTTVYELLSDVSNDSEFMFEMDPEKQSYNQYTEAYELLQQGKIKAAQEKLKHFVEDCPDDLPGRKLFDLVESLPHFDMSQKVSPVYTLESISKRNIEW